MKFDLAGFAAHMMTIEKDLNVAAERTVMRGAALIQKKAKGMMGHEQPIWPALKPETIARKAKGNTPLLESGALRASIEVSGPVS